MHIKEQFFRKPQRFSPKAVKAQLWASVIIDRESNQKQSTHWVEAMKDEKEQQIKTSIPPIKQI